MVVMADPRFRHFASDLDTIPYLNPTYAQKTIPGDNSEFIHLVPQVFVFLLKFARVISTQDIVVGSHVRHDARRGLTECITTLTTNHVSSLGGL